MQALATDFVAGDSLPSALTVPAIGTAGADALGGAVVHGLDGNDHLSGNRQVGGPGDDVLDDPDTVVFGRGDGHDTVTLYNSWSKQAVSTLPSWIEMQPGISASDLAFGIEGRDLIVTIRDTGDSVTVRRHFERYSSYPNYSYLSAIAGVRFGDGTTMGFDQVADAIGVGTDGDDMLGSVSVLLDDIRAGDGDDIVTLPETNAYSARAWTPCSRSAASRRTTVIAAAPILKTDSSEVGTVIEETAIKELPLNGRNFATLVYLTPRITPGQSGDDLSGASTFNPRGASNFNALGHQAKANGWLLDGIDNNEYTFNTVIVVPSVEQVREFKVLSGVFSAEFGRGSGVVSVSTKSGNNEWHGTAFEYLRNEAFDAKNFFALPGPLSFYSGSRKRCDRQEQQEDERPGLGHMRIGGLILGYSGGDIGVAAKGKDRLPNAGAGRGEKCSGQGECTRKKQGSCRGHRQPAAAWVLKKASGQINSPQDHPKHEHAVHVDPQQHQQRQPPPGACFVRLDPLEDQDPDGGKEISKNMRPRQHVDHTGGKPERRDRQRCEQAACPAGCFAENDRPGDGYQNGSQQDYPTEPEKIV